MIFSKKIRRKNFKTPIILAANPTPLLFKELTYIIMKNYKLKRIFLPLSPKLIFNILKLIEFFVPAVFEAAIETPPHV